MRSGLSRRGAGTPYRLFLEALLYLAVTGRKRRQLPERHGKWYPMYNRILRWLAAGVLERVRRPAGRPTARRCVVGVSRL